MRQFNITGPNFEGEMRLFYMEGKLTKIDLTECRLKDSQRRFIFLNAATDETQIEGMMKKLPTCTLVAEDYVVTLDEFKRVYPYARNSHLLPPIWAKMKPSEKVRAWQSAIQYARYCSRNGWYKPKIAAKWLKDREWMNDWKRM